MSNKSSTFADYSEGNITDKVLEITNGQGVSKGLDAVGRDNDIDVANSLAFEGEMLELVDVVRPTEYTDAFMKGLSFHQLSLGSGHRYGPAAEAKLGLASESFSELVVSGVIKVHLSKVISLGEVGDALLEMLKQRTVGKVVMKVQWP